MPTQQIHRIYLSKIINTLIVETYNPSLFDNTEHKPLKGGRVGGGIKKGRVGVEQRTVKTFSMNIQTPELRD